MEQVVGVLATLLNEKPDVLTESLKTEEGVNEITNRVKSLKVFNDDSFSELTNNIKKSFKDEVYGEVKGTAYEMLEKDLKKSYDLSWKRGEDYSNVSELITKLVETNKANSNTGDEQLKKDLEALRTMLTNTKQESETSVNQLQTQHQKELADIYLNAELSELKSYLDYPDEIVNGQLELFKIALGQRYKIGFDAEKKLIVSDSEGNVIKNSDFTPKHLKEVVSEVAKNFLKFKDIVPKSGRGNGNPQNNNPISGSELKKFTTFEDFLLTDQGKELQMGSIAMAGKFKEWKTAHS